MLVFILVVFGSGWGKGVGAQNSTVSPSSFRPNSVNIGALFTFSSVIGRAVKPAIAAAIDDVNSNSSILPGTKLNLIFHDTNCSGFLGTMEGNTLSLDLLVVHSGLSCCLWTQKQSIVNDHPKTLTLHFALPMLET